MIRFFKMTDFLEKKEDTQTHKNRPPSITNYKIEIHRREYQIDI